MRFPVLALLSALMVGPVTARAGDLTVLLIDQRGAPVADAVVSVAIAGAASPSHFAQPLRMSQRDMQFSPFVLAVPVGADVSFSNEDKVRHQIFSFSPAKRFELKLFGHDQTHSIHFDKPGVVALGCNIHDNMVAYVKVTDAPFAVVTDGSGRAVFHGLPGGSAQVRAWQPYLRAPGNELQATVAIPRTGSVERDLAAPVLPPHKMS